MKKVLFAALLVLGVAAILAPPQPFAQEEKPFTIHGEVRQRAEDQNNASDLTDSGSNCPPGSGVGCNDDGALFFPYRIRIAAEGHFSKNVHAWIEFQNAGVWGGDVNLFGAGGNPVKNGSGFGVGTSSNVELYQGYLTLDELWSKHFSLTIGRQEIVRGNELLLGDLDFYSGLSHDGVTGTWDFKKVNVLGFFTRPTEGSVSMVSNFLPPDQVGINAAGGTQNFWGAYATMPVHKNWVVDYYWLELRSRFTGGSNPSTLDTIGGRFAHDVTDKAGLVWNAEYAMQFGKISDLAPANAGDKFGGNVFEGMVGWNFKTNKNMQRVYGRYAKASGDDDATDDKIKSFQPLFGDFHNRLGHGDWFQLNGGAPTALNGGPANGTGSGITAWSVGWTGWFKERHELGAAYWDYQLDKDATLTDGSTSKKLGKAEDVWYGFNYTKNVAFLASYSQLKPDSALSDSGGTQDTVTRLYGQVRLRF